MTRVRVGSLESEPIFRAGLRSQELEIRVRTGVRGQISEPRGRTKVRGQELKPRVRIWLPEARSQAGSKARAGLDPRLEQG